MMPGAGVEPAYHIVVMDFKPDQGQKRKPMISNSNLISLAFFVPVILGKIGLFLQKMTAAGTI
jgi:hypothetical protein